MSSPRPFVLLRRRIGHFSDDGGSSADAAPTELDGHEDAMARGDREPTTLVVERAAWSFVWLGVIVGGGALWGDWWSWPGVAALAPFLVVIGVAGMAWCWWGRTPRSWAHQGLAMLGAATAMVAPQVVSLHSRIDYSTDSAALDHVAARLLAAGHNPYTTSLASARLLLSTPDAYWTYTVTGGHVSGVSYPAGSFLFYAPAFALGFRHLVVDWMDLYAWLAALALLFFMLPRRLAWVAGLVTFVGVFTGLFISGGTDAAFMPFALVAVWRWDRFGRARAAGLARWVGPVALGVACSIKQTPWFLVPFLVVGVLIEARRDGRPVAAVGGRYLGLVLAAFTLVNLPFIVLSPQPWWHDSLLPFTAPLVADGQGVVSLALHGLTGGANLSLLDLASVLALAAVLVSFVAWYPVLKRVWLVLLPAALFFAPRSFTPYLIDFFPMALVGLLTVEPATAPALTWRWGRFQVARLAVAGLSAATGVLTALALTSRPLDVSYVSAAIGHGQEHVDDVVVSVTNTTGQTVRPHFLVDINSEHPTGFWTTAQHRPVVLRPHDTATVVLYPPEPTYLPPWATDFVVDAYIASPRSLSTTTDIWHNYVPTLTPAQQRATGTRGRP